MAFASEMEHIAQAVLSAVLVHINSSLEQHVVMPKRGVWIPFIDAVVNQERETVSLGNGGPYFDGRVLMNAERGFEPDDDRPISVESIYRIELTGAFGQMTRESVNHVLRFAR